MRDILFRGKRLDNGEWIEGCYVKCQDNINPHTGYIAPAVSSLAFEDDDTITIGGFYKVDPATVGQYTGLTDKNGVKIFEGDIVRCGNRAMKYPIKKSEVIGNIYDDPELLEVE